MVHGVIKYLILSRNYIKEASIFLAMQMDKFTSTAPFKHTVFPQYYFHTTAKYGGVLIMLKLVLLGFYMASAWAP